MTTIRDVAERAQVSTATVSRVLNEHPSVNPVIRRAVLKAAEELNFQPNGVARTLRTARTQTLALLVTGMRNADLLSPLLLGAESVAHEHGYAMFVCNTRQNDEVTAQYLRNLANRRVDGILFPPRMPLGPVQAFTQRTGIPVVVYGSTAPIDALPHTVLRFSHATEEAIDHLLTLGHRRFGTVTYISESQLDPRFGWGAAFIRQALRARGVEPVAGFHLTVESDAECTAAVREMLARRPRPTAVFVTNIFLAPATLAGVRAAGARVPADLSLIGCGDSGWTQSIEPPLSVVAADLSEHLADSTRLLINLIGRNTKLPVTLEHRAQYTRRASVQAAPDALTAVAAGASAADGGAG